MTEKKQDPIVCIRIRMGQYELEVKGPQSWADKAIDEFIARHREDIHIKQTTP